MRHLDEVNKLVANVGSLGQEVVVRTEFVEEVEHNYYHNYSIQMFMTKPM